MERELLFIWKTSYRSEVGGTSNSKWPSLVIIFMDRDANEYLVINLHHSKEDFFFGELIILEVIKRMTKSWHSINVEEDKPFVQLVG